MVRGKIQMKRIENTASRQVTFSKRRNGLLKKAYELSVLCDAQIAVIIFSQSGRLSEFSSCSDITKILERYHKYTKEVPADKFGDDYIQQLLFNSASMAKEIEHLELSIRKLLGHNLNTCSFDELHEIEDQLQRSLQSVRLKKDQLNTERIKQLQLQESNVLKENAELKAMWQWMEKTSQQQWRHAEAEAEGEAVPHSSNTNTIVDVETQLFIGLPNHRSSS